MGVSCSHGYRLNRDVQRNIVDWPQPAAKPSVHVRNNTNFIMSTTRMPQNHKFPCSPKNPAHGEVSRVIDHNQMISCYSQPSDSPRHVFRSEIHAVHREHVHRVTRLGKTNTSELNTGIVSCVQLEIISDKAKQNQKKILLGAVKMRAK